MQGIYCSTQCTWQVCQIPAYIFGRPSGVELVTFQVANKEVKSSSKNHNNIVEETANKKKVLTTTKTQKEATKRRKYTETKGKYLYILLKRHYCL